MKYSHLVKHNGVYYKAGEEVPNSSPVSVVEKDNQDGAPGTSDKGEYKKTEINRMNVENLKVFASKIGLEVTEESTGSSLKKDIIEKLGL